MRSLTSSRLAALAAAMLAACGGGASDAPVNRLPVARAGADRAVTTLEVVTLDGSASTDEDGDALTYRWTLAGRPAGSQSVLSSATSASPALVPDLPGEYLVSLVVDDGRAQSPADATVVTAAASWKAPRALDGAGTDLLTAATNGSGDAVAVWRFSGAEGSGLRAARYDGPADLWSAPVELLAPTQDGCDRPRVALGRAGDAVAAWGQLIGGGLDYWASVLDHATGTWSAPASVTAGATMGYAGPPRVAVNGAGQALVVWSELHGASYDLWAATYDPATGWGAPTPLEEDAGDASNGRVALDDAGRALVVWIQGPDSLSYELRARAFDFGTGAWGAAQAVDPSAGTGLVSLSPSIAMSPGGLAVVAWVVQDLAQQQRNDVWVLRYDAAGGGWSGGREVDGTDDTSAEPSVAIDDAGNAAVVWWQYDGAWTRVGSSAFDAGLGAWEAPALLDGGGRQCGIPAVAVDGAGHALAVWPEHDGVALDLRSAFRDLPAGPWRAPALVAAGIGGSLNEAPWAGTSGAGRAVAAWSPAVVVTFR